MPKRRFKFSLHSKDLEARKVVFVDFLLPTTPVSLDAAFMDLSGLFLNIYLSFLCGYSVTFDVTSLQPNKWFTTFIYQNLFNAVM